MTSPQLLFHLEAKIKSDVAVSLEKEMSNRACED